MGEIEPLVPGGELTMPAPGLDSASWSEGRPGRKPVRCGHTCIMSVTAGSRGVGG
ncbi:NIF3 family metal-binding protein [Escherichia coli]|nr:NIF3 family metal-binding protein [Escherichia coli]